MSDAARRRRRMRGAVTMADDGAGAGRRPPALPRLTIARSPVNDLRVIVDALSMAPLARLLAGDGDAWLGEHRAELRALLQHLSTRLSAAIERGAAMAGDTIDTPEAPPVLTPHAGESPSGTSPRPAERHRRSRGTVHAPPAARPAVEWEGRSILR